MKLFDRKYKLTIGAGVLGIEITDLDIQFSVKKSIKPEPNTCELRVMNLSPSSRRLLESEKLLPVRLEAGYKEGMSLIFEGEVRTAHSLADGATIVTQMSTGDGEKAIRSSRVSMTVGPKAPIQQVFEQLAKSLGVKDGNLKATVGRLAAKGLGVFAKGAVIHGPAAPELTSLCDTAGLEWNIHDGALNFTEKGQPHDGTAVLISSDTGMVGSPTVDSEGVAECTCLMIPDLKIGAKVSFDTLSVKGGYRIIAVEYSGDTAGDEWFAKIHAKKY